MVDQHPAKTQILFASGLQHFAPKAIFYNGAEHRRYVDQTGLFRQPGAQGFGDVDGAEQHRFAVMAGMLHPRRQPDGKLRWGQKTLPGNIQRDHPGFDADQLPPVMAVRQIFGVRIGFFAAEKERARSSDVCGGIITGFGHGEVVLISRNAV
ncbi:hypothetical protein D3C76_1230230 [compost metagenome]